MEFEGVSLSLENLGQDLLELVVGEKWPDGDENAMRQLAAEWRNAATQLEEIRADATNAARAVDHYLQGANADAFQAMWSSSYDGGQDTGRGGSAPPALPFAVSFCRSMANVLEAGANQIETTKDTILGNIAILVATVTPQIIAGFADFGATDATAAAEIVAERTATQAFLAGARDLLIRMVEQAIEQGVLQGALNFEIQFKEVQEGHASGIDFGAVLQSAEGGALGGALGTGLGAGAGALGSKMLGDGIASSVAGRAVTGIAVGGLTNAAMDVAQTGHLSASDFTKGSLAGAAGAAAEDGARGTEEAAGDRLALPDLHDLPGLPDLSAAPGPGTAGADSGGPAGAAQPESQADRISRLLSPGPSPQDAHSALASRSGAASAPDPAPGSDAGGHLAGTQTARLDAGPDGGQPSPPANPVSRLINHPAPPPETGNGSGGASASPPGLDSAIASSADVHGARPEDPSRPASAHDPAPVTRPEPGVRPEAADHAVSADQAVSPDHPGGAEHPVYGDRPGPTDRPDPSAGRDTLDASSPDPGTGVDEPPRNLPGHDHSDGSGTLPETPEHGAEPASGGPGTAHDTAGTGPAEPTASHPEAPAPGTRPGDDAPGPPPDQPASDGPVPDKPASHGAGPGHPGSGHPDPGPASPGAGAAPDQWVPSSAHYEPSPGDGYVGGHPELIGLHFHDPGGTGQAAGARGRGTPGWAPPRTAGEVPERLANISARAEVSDHGISMFPDPVMHEMQRWIPPDPGGAFDINLHGNEISARSMGKNLSAQDLLDLADAHGHQDGQPIRLTSCKAGALDDGLAADLARVSGCKVIAADSLVWTDTRGHMFASGSRLEPDLSLVPDIPPTGHWHEFSPDGTRTQLDDNGFPPGDETGFSRWGGPVGETLSRGHGWTPPEELAPRDLDPYSADPRDPLRPLAPDENILNRTGTLPPDSRIQLWDTAGNHRGEIFTDSDGEITHAEVQRPTAPRDAAPDSAIARMLNGDPGPAGHGAPRHASEPAPAPADDRSYIDRVLNPGPSAGSPHDGPAEAPSGPNDGYPAAHHPAPSPHDAPVRQEAPAPHHPAPGPEQHAPAPAPSGPPPVEQTVNPFTGHVVGGASHPRASWEMSATERAASRYGDRPVADPRSYGDVDNFHYRYFKSNDQAADYGHAAWRSAYGQLTPEEDGAVQDYTGDSYGPLNKILRAGHSLTGGFRDLVGRLDRVMNKQPVPENTVAIRVTSLDAFHGANMRTLAGETFHEPAYMSTALGPEPTYGSADDPGRVVLHLDVPAGTPGMYVDPVSSTPGERELLLGRGLSYTVTRSHEMKDGWHVWARINR